MKLFRNLVKTDSVDFNLETESLRLEITIFDSLICSPQRCGVRQI
jgi:hypothetical protein